ncbi:hypothetical protein jhhlp_004984 [Lomentospora prolificans]|uniref:DUF6594 domain-containing protein n=1 Tax=Lomentospora prolificans TaxID=41688 RepID=A0A2N3N845_9PEZI|nr:hypothetical protein jhhlp_004984 [Lomentospora prolificans]
MTIGEAEKNVATADPISKAAVDAARRHIYYAHERGERFNITALHRMNLHYMRKRLIDETAVILKKGEMDDENSKTLTSLIRDYCTAVRDREYMRASAYPDWQDCLFHLKSERPMERDLLNYFKECGVQPEEAVLVHEDQLMPALPGGPWDYWPLWRMKRERYSLAILGAVILNVPMVIMVLVPTPVVSLVTVVVCTMLFAVASAYFSPSKLPIELLVATAAYAAVLVVFVGSATESTAK